MWGAAGRLGPTQVFLYCGFFPGHRLFLINYINEFLNIITKTINVNEEIMTGQLPLIQTRFLKKYFQICKQAACWDVYFEF
jgi:hypothetical protein